MRMKTFDWNANARKVRVGDSARSLAVAQFQTCMLVAPDPDGDPYARMMAGVPDLVPPARGGFDAMAGRLSPTTKRILAPVSCAHPAVYPCAAGAAESGLVGDDALSYALGEIDACGGGVSDLLAGLSRPLVAWPIRLLTTGQRLVARFLKDEE
jgi:hypothetical protein